MFESMQNLIPTEWRGATTLLSAPLAWIPDWHGSLVNFAWYGNSLGEVLIKRALLLLPTLLLLAAVWTTMVSLYTLPFRSRRGSFLTAMVMAWWDAGRSTWLYWSSAARLAIVSLGWIWSTLRLAFRLAGSTIKQTFQSPLRVIDWTSRNYFKPGVPWVAFLALLLWSAVEATIFMYTLSPTVTEVLGGITGFPPNPMVVGPLLWLFLYFLILGSFACIEVLGAAVRQRRIPDIIQMSLVELSVMFFEVIFLYRELIDAVTPWIAQQTNESWRLGLWSTLALASFGWVGVRGMTWFLFGRFGTPAVLAVLGRETIKQGAEGLAQAPALTHDAWKGPIQALKDEVRWFREEAARTFEMLTLPVLELLAAAVNFAVIVILGRPWFRLPFRSIEEAMAQTPHRDVSEKVKSMFEAPPPPKAAGERAR